MGDPRCRWCGKTKEEHRPPSEANRPRARCPCLCWREHFVPRPEEKPAPVTVSERCPRCRLPVGEYADAVHAGVCLAATGFPEDVIRCRNREIADLRAALGATRARLAQALSHVDELLAADGGDRG